MGNEKSACSLFAAEKLMYCIRFILESLIRFGLKARIACNTRTAIGSDPVSKHCGTTLETTTCFFILLLLVSESHRRLRLPWGWTMAGVKNYPLQTVENRRKTGSSPAFS